MKNASLAALLSLSLFCPAAALAQSAPAPAPGDPASPTAPTSPPPADQPAAPAPAANKWAGSSLYTTFSFPTYGIFRGQQLSPDEAVNYFVRVSPRYQLAKDWQLRAMLGGNVDIVEGINTGTTYAHEFVLSDPALQFFYQGLPKLPGGIRMGVAATVRLPLSKTSWAQGLIASPGLTTQLARPFSVLGGDALVLAQVGYQRPIYTQGTPTTSRSYPTSTFKGFGSFGTADDQFTGAVNVRDSFSLLLLAVQSWGKWQPGIFLLATAQVPYNVKPLGLPQDNTTDWRVRGSTYFAAFLDYEVNDWLIPEIGVQMMRSVLDADGTYGNPFFSRYQDTQLYVGANVQLDVLYKSLTGDAGQGGVVRAARTPVGMRF